MHISKALSAENRSKNAIQLLVALVTAASIAMISNAVAVESLLGCHMGCHDVHC